MKRIIAPEIKPNTKGIHPLTFEIYQNNEDSNIYPTSFIDLDSKEYLKFVKKNIKSKDDELEKRLFKDYMEKPYVPIDNTFILAANNVNNKMISLEEFYNQQDDKKSINIKRVINCWFRYNFKEYNNEIQKNIIIKFFKQLLLDNLIEKSEKEIKKHLDEWFSTKKSTDFEYNLSSYILKM
jgi:hypothetical protein